MKRFSSLIPSCIIVFLLLAPTLSFGQIKSPPAGLATRSVIQNKISYCQPPNVGIDATVCQIQWQDLEPKQGEFNFSLIDTALKQITDFNATPQNAAPYSMVLRIEAGRAAPEWLKASVGSFTSEYRNENDVYQVVDFWKPEFTQAYSKMMTALAQRYDTNPLVKAVNASACMTMHEEVMYRNTGRAASSKNIESMIQAGWDPASSDQACWSAMMDVHKSVWQNTPTMVFLNALKSFSRSNTIGVINPRLAPAYMNDCLSKLGTQRCLLGNASFSLEGHNKPINKQLDAAHVSKNANIFYQTNVFDQTLNPGNLDDTLLSAAQNHYAFYVELPMGYNCPDGKLYSNECKTDGSDPATRSPAFQRARALLKSNAPTQ